MIQLEQKDGLSLGLEEGSEEINTMSFKQLVPKIIECITCALNDNTKLHMQLYTIMDSSRSSFNGNAFKRTGIT